MRRFIAINLVLWFGFSSMCFAFNPNSPHEIMTNPGYQYYPPKKNFSEANRNYQMTPEQIELRRRKQTVEKGMETYLLNEIQSEGVQAEWVSVVMSANHGMFHWLSADKSIKARIIINKKDATHQVAECMGILNRKIKQISISECEYRSLEGGYSLITAEQMGFSLVGFKYSYSNDLNEQK